MICLVKEESICILFAAGALYFIDTDTMTMSRCGVKHSVFYSLGL